MSWNFDNSLGSDGGSFEHQYNRVQSSVNTFLLKMANEEQLALNVDKGVGSVRISGVTFKISSDFLDEDCRMKRIVVLILNSTDGGLIRFNKLWATEKGEINLIELRESFNYLRIRS